MRKDHELHRRRRSRNIGVLIALIGLAALLFWVTVVKLGMNVRNPMG